jgi:hypothetical protein
MPPSKVRAVIENLFRIYDKEGNLVDFILNDIQAQIDEEIIAPIEACEAAGFDAPPELLAKLKSSILKYRQGGVSTLILAWFLTKCMHRYAVCVMLTHDKEHSEKLLYRARIMLKNMKGPQPKTNKLNDNEIAFAKTNSLFYIGTAGSKEFGRSATITHLHCSEIAFWKDPGRLMKSLFQAVPKRTGVIIHETTANGWGNWFQKSFYNYLGGKGGFCPFFFPWFIHNEYLSNTPLVWDSVSMEERKTERALYRLIKRSTGNSKSHIRRQLQWRREKIDENEGDQGRDNAIRDFNQEYPATVEEAFVNSGGSLFPNVRRVDSPRWRQHSLGAYILEGHPRAEFSYSLGADFAGGTGNDDSSINILCVETREQVYRYANNRINPVDFAMRVVEVGKLFNEAYLVPEYNNHGIAGVAIIKKHYNLQRIIKHVMPRGFNNSNMNIPSYGYGWKTSGTSKPYMVGITQQFMQARWKLYDPLTEEQLRSFSEDPETHKLEGDGAHDDNAISLMLACIGVLKLYRIEGIDPEATTEQAMIDTVMVLTKPIVAKSPQDSSASVSWRDASGSYLIPFKDMFGKGRRSVHV